MNFNDGCFKLKTNSLSKSVDEVYHKACDTSISEYINGVQDIQDAQRLVNKMLVTISLLNAQVENINSELLKKNKTTTCAREK